MNTQRCSYQMVNYAKPEECGHATSIVPSEFKLQERKDTVGMTSSFWDIPGIRSQQALEFVAGLLEPICVYDNQGQAIYANPSFLALLQTQIEKVHFFDYFQSEMKQLTILETVWKQALQGESIEFTDKTRDGNLPLKCSLHFHPDSKLMFLKVTPLKQLASIHPSTLLQPSISQPSPQSSITQLASSQLSISQSSITQPAVIQSSITQSSIAAYEQIRSALLHHPNLITALIRADGLLSQANQKLYDLLGIHENELVYIEELVYPEDRLIDFDLCQKLLDGSLPSYTIEKRFITRTQEIVWFNVSISLLTLLQPLNGYTTYFIALLEDITETKKIYNALIRTEGKWKSFVLNSRNLFLQTSSMGRILYASPAIERILGYQEEELLDLHISHLIHPEDLNEFNLALHLWARGMQLNQPNIECRWKTQIGGWAYLSIQGQQFPLALDIEGIVISGYDITDRKQLENQLRASEEKYRSLVANLPGAILRCDTTYAIEFISEGIEAIAGYPATDFIADRRRSYLSIVHPNDIELIKDSMLESLLNHRICSIEYRIIHADGRIRWVSERRKGMFDIHNQLLYFDIILSDITDRKQAEEHLRRSEAVNRAIAQVVPDLIPKISNMSEISDIEQHPDCSYNPPYEGKNAHRLL